MCLQHGFHVCGVLVWDEWHIFICMDSRGIHLYLIYDCKQRLSASGFKTSSFQVIRMWVCIPTCLPICLCVAVRLRTGCADIYVVCQAHGCEGFFIINQVFSRMNLSWWDFRGKCCICVNVWIRCVCMRVQSFSVLNYSKIWVLTLTHTSP